MIENTTIPLAKSVDTSFFWCLRDPVYMPAVQRRAESVLEDVHARLLAAMPSVCFAINAEISRYDKVKEDVRQLLRIHVDVGMRVSKTITIGTLHVFERKPIFHPSFSVFDADRLCKTILLDLRTVLDSCSIKR